MRLKKVEKRIKDEGKIIVPDVFSDVLNSLGIEEPKPVKKPFFNRKLLVPAMSSMLCAGLVLGIVVINNNSGDSEIALASNTYVAMQIETGEDDSGYVPEAYQSEGSPSFTYNVNKKGKTTNVIAINDPAKIVATGLKISESENYNVDILSSSIVKESASIGFLNLSSKNNVVRLNVSGIDEKARKTVLDTITNEITAYFKANYIYGEVIATEEGVAEGIEDDEKYAAIYNIYELTKELFSSIYENPNFDAESQYSSLESWQETLKDVSIEDLNFAIERLETIRNQFLKYDHFKKVFSKNLMKLYGAYTSSYDYIREGYEYYDYVVLGYDALVESLKADIQAYKDAHADYATNESLTSYETKLASLEAIVASDGERYSFYDWLFFKSINLDNISEGDSYDSDDRDYDDDYGKPDWDDDDEWGDFDDNWDDDWDGFDDDDYDDDYDDDDDYYDDGYGHGYRYGPGPGPSDNDPELSQIKRQVRTIDRQVKYMTEIQMEYRYNIKRILATIEYVTSQGYDYDYDDKYHEYGNKDHDHRDDDWEDEYDYDDWYNSRHHHH